MLDAKSIERNRKIIKEMIEGKPLLGSAQAHADPGQAGAQPAPAGAGAHVADNNQAANPQAGGPGRGGNGDGGAGGRGNGGAGGNSKKWQVTLLGALIGAIAMAAFYAILDEWDLYFKVRKSVAETTIEKNRAEAKKEAAEATKKEAEAKKKMEEVKAIERGLVKPVISVKSESCPQEADLDGIVRRNNVQVVGTAGVEYHFGPGCVIVNLRASIEQVSGTGYYFSTIDQNASGGFLRPARDVCGTHGDATFPGMNCIGYLNRHRGSNVMVIVGNGGNIVLKGGM